MQVAVIGSGYVGTTIAAAFADVGHDVTAVDIDRSIVDRLNAGDAPIHEPGVPELVAEHAGDRLTATTDYAALADAEIVFVAVPTPTTEDGHIDTSAVNAAVDSALETMSDGAVLVVKSTVTPPQVRVLQQMTDGTPVRFATNPEFQREGSALSDFRSPDKLVFGATDAATYDVLRRLYDPIIVASDPAIIETDPETAAMIKYANNAILAAKISLINDIGNVCKVFGIDTYEVADAVGQDHRISEEFLASGVGFGGSCFPKDVAALIAAARDADYDPPMLAATMQVNEGQPDRMVELLDRHVDVEDARIAVLGLAFKPGTDDIRNSRAIPLIERLRERGADIVAHDPVATDAMRDRFPDVSYTTDVEAALADADGAVVTTDWPMYAELDDVFDTMASPVVIDGRRIVTRRDGLVYEGLTW